MRTVDAGTTKHTWNSQMVHQLHYSAKTQGNSVAVPGPIKAQPSTTMANKKGTNITWHTTQANIVNNITIIEATLVHQN